MPGWEGRWLCAQAGHCRLPEHCLHTLTPPGISHTQLVSSGQGTASLETHPEPHWCLQMLVLHRRGRRESLTRLGLKDLTPGKIICLFWESADSTRSRTHSSRCRKGAEHSSGHEQALAAHRRAGPEGPRANASVCGALVPKGLMGSCSSSLALKTLSWRSSHLPEVFSSRTCISLSLETQSKLNMFLLQSSCCF